MRDQSATSPRFPSTCARCGGVVAEPVSFCPHCGTHARLAFGREAPRAAPANNGPELSRADAPLASRPTPLFASANFDHHGNSRPPTAGSSRQWGIKGGTALALFAFVLLYGGLVLLHRQDDSATRMQQATLRTAEGSVIPADATAPQSVQPAKPPTPAPSTASIVAAASDLTELPPVPRDGSGRSPRTRTAVASVVAPSPGRIDGQPAISAPRSERETAARAPSAAIHPAPGETRGERRPALAARFVAAAEDSLAKNNLAATHRAIAAALTVQPDNSEAFMLRQDLHSRETARDAALSAARACAVQKQWNCAWHNAGSALSIDSSSVEAKALVDRAIVESGAAARPPGPGPDGPDVPMLTQ